MLLNSLLITLLNPTTTHPAIANLYLFAKLFRKARKTSPRLKIELFPGPITTINWVLILLFAVFALMMAIAILRILFGVLYTSGSNDTQLLRLMRIAGIPNWKALKQQAGITDTTLWQLRDGNITQIKLNELQQISHILNISIGELLQQYSVSLDDPQATKLYGQNQQLQTQLNNIQAENNQLKQQIETLKTGSKTTAIATDKDSEK